MDVDFLRRFLLVFQTLNHHTNSRVAARSNIVDPVRADPKFLPWLGSWLGFTLDERIPVTRRRIFLRRAVELFRWRGTVRGLCEMVKTLTGLTITIQGRRGPQPMELGNCALSRPPADLDEDDRSEAASESAALSLPYVTHAGEHLLVSPRFAREEYFTIELEERDVLVRRYRDRLPELLEQIVRIAMQERPAHLNFVICFRDEGAAHNELVLAGAGATTPNSVLGRACLAYNTSTQGSHSG
jgi:phage tail-like protein